jgi:hypothetical protein
MHADYYVAVDPGPGTNISEAAKAVLDQVSWTGNTMILLFNGTILRVTPKSTIHSILSDYDNQLN